MPKTDTLTPAQASYIVEKLIAARRLSRSDVRGYLEDMQSEIRDLEQRLAGLRAVAGTTAVAPPAPRSEVRAPKTRKRRTGGKKGHVRGIAGTFAVLTRNLPDADRAKYEALRASKGLKAAVAELRKIASRR